MPELPEVEVIRRGLESLIIGKRITDIAVLTQRSFLDFDAETHEKITGAAFTAVSRRGKLLVFALDNDCSLLVHLRMTGQLIYRGGRAQGQADAGNIADGGQAQTQPDGDFAGGAPNASLIGKMPDKTTRVILEFMDASHLYFNDQRKFGYMQLVPTKDVEKDGFVARLGVDALSDSFTPQSFKAALPRDSKRTVKAALLDQNIVAGIGNIYADESLFAARIDPQRSVASLTNTEIKRLHAAIVERLHTAIASGGSTARNYVDSQGLRGEFLDLHAKVFNRTGQPCPKCGRPIQKTRVAGRGTHYCPHCQR